MGVGEEGGGGLEAVRKTFTERGRKKWDLGGSEFCDRKV